jgi:hypothetical protein
MISQEKTARFSLEKAATFLADLVSRRVLHRLWDDIFGGGFNHRTGQWT